MLIVITGNIASGKSTLAKEIKKATGFQLLSIDDYRKRHNRSNCDIGESQAWYHLIKHIKKGGNLILELTGTGQHYEKCLLHYSGHKIVIMMPTDAETCKKNHLRRMKRGYKMPPMPFENSIVEQIDTVDILLKMVDYDILFDNNISTKELIGLLTPTPFF